MIVIFSCPFLLQEKLQEQLDEQAQRYEEQLTELHSVIAELTRKLHQQRSMAIAEEDEVSGEIKSYFGCYLYSSASILTFKFKN